MCLFELLGDFNTDVSDVSYATYKAYNNFCKSSGLTQIIKGPTPVCQTTQTTTDLILVTDESNITHSGVIGYGISDHYLIYCTRKRHRVPFSAHKVICIRSLKNYSVETLRSQLKNLDWSPITNACDVDKAWGTFKCLFIKAVDAVAPPRQIRIKQRSNPWFDHSIREMIKQWDSALAKFRKSQEPDDFEHFKKCRNITQKMIKTSKQNYYSEVIKDNSKNPSKLWKTLKT